MSEPLQAGFADGFTALPPERAEIAALSRRARLAVLSPQDPGGWPADWRHAVAARICRAHGEEGLALGYLAGLRDAGLAELALPGSAGRDAAETEILRILDTIATRPAAVVDGDIVALGLAGVSQADIVRLCELAAFLAYECRVARGLSLLKGPSS